MAVLDCIFDGDVNLDSAFSATSKVDFELPVSFIDEAQRLLIERRAYFLSKDGTEERSAFSALLKAFTEITLFNDRLGFTVFSGTEFSYDELKPRLKCNRLIQSLTSQCLNPSMPMLSKCGKEVKRATRDSFVGVLDEPIMVQAGINFFSLKIYLRIPLCDQEGSGQGEGEVGIEWCSPRRSGVYLVSRGVLVIAKAYRRRD